MTDPHYHVGIPVLDAEILARVRSGLPAYLPTDPKVLDQTVYLEFAAKPEGAPKP